MVKRALYIWNGLINIREMFGDSVKKSTTMVSGLELKQLLIKLSEQPSICFRYRSIGELWMKNPMKVSAVNDSSVVLYDEKASRYQMIHINNIMQFELDERFQNFHRYFHYEVIPSPELA
jgi:hypothetical protein